MTTSGSNNENRIVDFAKQLDSDLRSGILPVRAQSSDEIDEIFDDLSKREKDELVQAQAAVCFLENVRRTLKDRVNRDTSVAFSKQHNSTILGQESEVPDGNIRDLKLETVGRFEIIEMVGQGGFAKVFRARDPLLKRDVALKIPKPQILMSSGATARFRREAESAAILSHPSIVPVFESGNVGPVAYIATELFPGDTLASWFASKKRRIDFQTTARIFSELADAVQHAHQRGIIHRDLKPANVLIAAGESDISSRLRITDFGLAKQIDSLDQCLTHDGAVVGTPAYMSPEQAGAETDLTARADIFSLGVMLYECLTGKLPFRGKNHRATIRLIESGEFIPPRKLNPSIPRDLESICLHCLHVLPGDRYESAFELCNDLRAWLENRPVKVRPLSSLQKFTRWNRRNPRVSLALTFAFLSLAIGFAATAWKWTESTANWQIAQEQEKKATRHANLAQQTLDSVLGKVTERLSDNPKFNELRTNLVAESVELQEQLLVAEPDNSRIRFETAAAHLRMGFIQIDIGQYQAATQSAERLSSILEPIEATKSVSQVDIQRLKFEGLLLEANSYRRRFKFGKANKILATLVPDLSLWAIENPDVQNNVLLLDCLITRGFTTSAKSRIELADHGLKIIETLNQDDLAIQIRESKLLKLKADIFLLYEQPMNATPWLVQSNEIAEKLTIQMPDSSDLQFLVAKLKYSFANRQRQLESLAEAVVLAAESREITRKLVDKFPNNAQFADHFFNCSTELIKLKLKAKQPDGVTEIRREIAKAFENISPDLALSPRVTQNTSLALARLAVEVSDSDTEDPEPYLKQAVRLTLLTRDNPPWPGCRRNTVVCYESYAMAMMNRQQHEKSLEYSRLAIKELHDLLPDWPTILPIERVGSMYRVAIRESILLNKLSTIDNLTADYESLLLRVLPLDPTEAGRRVYFQVGHEYLEAVTTANELIAVNSSVKELMSLQEKRLEWIEKSIAAFRRSAEFDSSLLKENLAETPELFLALELETEFKKLVESIESQETKSK